MVGWGTMAYIPNIVPEDVVARFNQKSHCASDVAGYVLARKRRATRISGYPLKCRKHYIRTFQR